MLHPLPGDSTEYEGDNDNTSGDGDDSDDGMDSSSSSASAAAASAGAGAAGSTGRGDGQHAGVTVATFDPEVSSQIISIDLSVHMHIRANSNLYHFSTRHVATLARYLFISGYTTGAPPFEADF